MTQKALAAVAGVHNATISGYERGRRPIAQANRAALLEAMGLPARAWEATGRRFEWLDYLSGASADDLPSIEAVAESFGREVEHHLMALLRLSLGRRADGLG